MSDIWSVLQWWEDWQLRILVLGSLGLQWFLLLATPMRKYTIPRIFRTCIWLAYISSDALAIYALATLFNRHARAMPAGSACPGGGIVGSKQQQSSILLEVLWAPILLIHLGGQEELTGYEIEDNELWTRHTVTLVSQVAVAIYAFCKSWPSASDWKLLAAAVLLFVIGVASFSEKPLALNRAKIKRLAAVSAWVQGTKEPSRWRERLNQFFLFEESNCFAPGMRQSLQAAGGEEEGSSFTDLMRWLSSCGTEGSNKKKPVALTEPDKVLMVLSDMSLLAAAKDLVARGKAETVEQVLPPLPVAEQALPRWLRSAFAFIYTRASVVVTPLYLVYHLLVVPALHIAALTLFATSDKHPYKRADVKVTYIIMCLTAALDVFAVFIRQLLYRLMAMTAVPALCETVPGYNIIDAARLESDKGFGWMYRCARLMGYSCREECLPLVARHQLLQLYRKVAQTVIADLVNARDRDLASYRIFDSTADTEKPTNNWALSKELQKSCGEVIKESLAVSFDRSVLLWHIATDLCLRYIDDEGQEEEKDEGEQEKGEVEGELGGGGGEELGGEFEGGGTFGEVEGQQPLPPPPQQRQGGGEEEELEVEQQPPPQQQQEDRETRGVGELQEGQEEPLPPPPPPQHHQHQQQRRRDPALRLHIECTSAISNYMAHLLNSNPEMLLTGSRHHLISEAMHEVKSSFLSKQDMHDDTRQVFHIIEACKLAKELLGLPDPTRWKLMYRVWLGMLCYSASMCRGYLHAKSLGEGGEFLSFVWLVLSLKGAKSLADKLQMPPETQASDAAESKAIHQEDKAGNET